MKISSILEGYKKCYNLRTGKMELLKDTPANLSDFIPQEPFYLKLFNAIKDKERAYLRVWEIYNETCKAIDLQEIKERLRNATEN